MRLFKPTKLRHGDDAMRAARLLSLDTSYLWFEDQGVVDEADHIATDRMLESPRRAEIDWATLFAGDTLLKRKEILLRAKGIPVRSVDRALADAVKDDGLLVKGPKEGEYSLRTDQKGESASETSPSPESI